MLEGIGVKGDEDEDEYEYDMWAMYVSGSS
jgi:hypothetical protein